MRAMTLERVETHMKLGKTLFAADGRVLLHRGTELSQRYLDHLRELGFTAVYIQDPAGADGLPAEMVSDQTRMQATAAVKDAFATIKGARDKRLNQDWTGRRALYNAASSIVTDVSSNRNLAIQMLELRGADGFTFAHSTNVCILGMALAQRLEVPYNKLVDLAIGLLIHDIGKLLLPEDLRVPEADLPEDRRTLYESHCEGGYGLLKDLGSTFGAPSKIIALQHHERWDGLGYPRGLQGDEIHEFAQICAIANTYDLLTTSRAFGRQVAPHEALEFLMGAGGQHFRLGLVQAFLEVVAPYPIGSTVKLNTGEAGLVVRIEKGIPQRPVLRLVGSNADDEFALTEHRDRVIVGLVEYN